MIYQSFSSARTKAFAERVARDVKRKGVGRRAFVITLRGELGAGKTTFVAGFARAIGAMGRVQSPTFVIVRRMPVRKPPFKNLFHVDAYRIKSAKEVSEIGFREMTMDPRNIVLIEWPERLGAAVPRGALEIIFEHGKTATERTIRTTHPLL